MLITPNVILEDWLRARGLPAGELELTDAQVAHLDELRKQAASFTHYGPLEREAWAVWTALTHASAKPAALVAPASLEQPQAALVADETPEPVALEARGEHFGLVWLRWLVLLAAILWRHNG